jgi:tetratricopeptide (TPR) repeat protein
MWLNARKSRQANAQLQNARDAKPAVRSIVALSYRYVLKFTSVVAAARFWLNQSQLVPMTAAAPNITPEEHEQILQTIEMFEVITQANPQDCQSLEILKDAYSRVGKTTEALQAARRLADTYLALGQFSSATLEYEGILQKQPDNAEVIAALGEVEERLAKSGQRMPDKPAPATNRDANGSRIGAINLDFKAVVDHGDPSLMTTSQTLRLDGASIRAAAIAPDMAEKLTEDGNEALAKFLIQHRIVAEEVVGSALERVQKRNKELRPNTLGASLIDEVCRRGAMDLDQLLCGILDRSKFAFIPLDYYDVDRSIIKMLPDSLTIARLIVPFDIISRTVMVATANPFDALGKQAVQQLLDYNVQWHLAAPQAIFKVLGETYRLA